MLILEIVDFPISSNVLELGRALDFSSVDFYPARPSEFISTYTGVPFS